MAKKVVDYEAVLLAVSYVESLVEGDSEQHELISQNVEKETLISGLTALSLIFVEFASQRIGAPREAIIDAARKTALDSLIVIEEN